MGFIKLLLANLMAIFLKIASLCLYKGKFGKKKNSPKNWYVETIYFCFWSDCFVKEPAAHPCNNKNGKMFL
jgi:hypothetical protein